MGEEGVGIFMGKKNQFIPGETREVQVEQSHNQQGYA